MLEAISSIHETVNFADNFGICLYRNGKCEDYPNHWHTPLEIIMPLSGGYRAECGDVSFELKDGDVLLINSCAVHGLLAQPEGERLILQVDISRLHVIKEIQSSLSIILSAVAITAGNQPEIHPGIVRLMREIEGEYFGDAPLKEAAMYSKVIEMLVLIGRAYATAPNKFDARQTRQKDYRDKFLYICGYIREHCTEDLTLDRISELAGFSKYHFTRLFKRFTNVSFYKYLTQQRIAHAEKLLADPGVSILEAAMRSGFSSPSAFIRMFKLIKKCTPSEFRSMYDL